MNIFDANVNVAVCVCEKERGIFEKKLKKKSTVSSVAC